MQSKRIIYILFLLLSLVSFSMITSTSKNAPILDNNINRNDLKTSQGKIFNNMYASYLFGFVGVHVDTRFEYSYVSGNYYNVTWIFEGEPEGSWLENKETREISNETGSLTFIDGSHAPIWLFTNLSITNVTLISLDGVGDFPFEVVYDFNISILGFEGLEAWYLINLINPDSYAIYEKSTGILIYGYFDFGIDFYTLQLTDTNIFSHYTAEAKEIPGFNLLLLIPTMILISFVIIIIIKKRRKIEG